MTKKLVIRAILNCNEDVFRDIAISGSETLEELHLQISKAYELDSGQMASFYKTDDNLNISILVDCNPTDAHQHTTYQD